MSQYEWVMSHIWMSHITHMNEPYHTYEWVMSRTFLNGTCHTHECVMSQIWLSHVTHRNVSCLTYEWVMSRIRVSHIAHTKQSRRTYEWVMSSIPTYNTPISREHMSRMRMIRVTIIKKVTLHIWISGVRHIDIQCCHFARAHVTHMMHAKHMNELRCIYKRVMSHI